MKITPTRVTAVAHPNIALVKYWGKRDERRILPHQSSLSVTLAPLEVKTSLELNSGATEIRLNGQSADAGDRERILTWLRSLPGVAADAKVRIDSAGNFPPAAGLASSAAGYAALAVAVRAATGQRSDSIEASLLARRGSGSACRSIEGGFCLWRRGTRKDGKDSYATQLFDERHWPDFRLVVALLDQGRKEVSSREGMRRTVDSSPYYAAWVADSEAEVRRASVCIERRDLQQLGELSERNAWRMHAAALAAQPALCYLDPATLGLILRVRDERKKGLPAWFTLDAGPNPLLISDSAHVAAVESLAKQCGAQRIITCWPGGDARLCDDLPERVDEALGLDILRRDVHSGHRRELLPQATM